MNCCCARMRVRKWCQLLPKILPLWRIVVYCNNCSDWKCFPFHRAIILHLPAHLNCSRTCVALSPPGCSRLAFFFSFLSMNPLKILGKQKANDFSRPYPQVLLTLFSLESWPFKKVDWPFFFFLNGENKICSSTPLECPFKSQVLSEKFSKIQCTWK